MARLLREETARDHRIIQADLSSAPSTRDFLRRFDQEVGDIDILVNNAGPFAMDPFLELSEQEWDRIWESNVRAAHLCAQALAPGMRRRGRGRIVNVSAGSAYIRNHSIYTLAKAALLTLTEALALELGPEISVNAVAPGQIAESADDIAEFDPSFVEKAIDRTPLRRLVTRGRGRHHRGRHGGADLRLGDRGNDTDRRRLETQPLLTKGSAAAVVVNRPRYRHGGPAPLRVRE